MKTIRQKGKICLGIMKTILRIIKTILRIVRQPRSTLRPRWRVGEGIVTGLSPKPVTMQTTHIQTNNANSDGLNSFSGKKLRNAHAREAALLPAQIFSKRFRSIFGIMYFCNIYILMVSRAVCAAWQMIVAGLQPATQPYPRLYVKWQISLRHTQSGRFAKRPYSMRHSPP